MVLTLLLITQPALNPFQFLSFLSPTLPAESTSRKDKDEIERLQKLLAGLTAAKEVADKALAGLTVENRGFQEAVDALKRQLLDAESQSRKDKDAIARLDKGY